MIGFPITIIDRAICRSTWETIENRRSPGGLFVGIVAKANSCARTCTKELTCIAFEIDEQTVSQIKCWIYREGSFVKSFSIEDIAVLWEVKISTVELRYYGSDYRVCSAQCKLSVLSHLMRYRISIGYNVPRSTESHWIFTDPLSNPRYNEVLTYIETLRLIVKSMLSKNIAQNAYIIQNALQHAS